MLKLDQLDEGELKKFRDRQAAIKECFDEAHLTVNALDLDAASTAAVALMIFTIRNRG